MAMSRMRRYFQETKPVMGKLDAEQDRRNRTEKQGKQAMKYGYGKSKDNIDGILTYSQDYTTKTRLLDITNNPRITNQDEDKLLSFLLKKIVHRRFTLMEARRIKGIAARKLKPT